MIVKLEDRQRLIELARGYWIEKDFSILEAIKQAESDLEGKYD